MRNLLCLVLAVLLHSSAVLAQEAALQVPAEYKAFFDDFSALINKYPAAAKRFGMYDRAPQSSPAMRSSGFCSSPGHCCTKWISEFPGQHRCVECVSCLP
jgi:hypothetical protein